MNNDLVPGPAAPPRSRKRRLAEGLRYLSGVVRGKSYLEYQVRRYDRLWRRDPRHFSWSDRTFQLEYCRAHGLSPEMTLLDYGCGPVAAGVHFIRYLDPGCYLGADISAEALRRGKAAISAAGLADKRPRLLLVPAADPMAVLRPRRADFVWAQSVLTHMDPRSVADLFVAARTFLRPGGHLYASFYLGDEVRRWDYKDWVYDARAMRELARAGGLSSEILDDFNHPRPYVRPGHSMAVVHLWA